MTEMQQSKTAGNSPDSLSGSLGAVVILALVVMVYFPSLRGGFLWDDDILLTANQHIKAAGTQGLSAIWFSSNQPDYLPLTSTSFWLEWRLWGMNPTGYRVTNLLLHALNSILLWRLLRRLKITGAFPAAILFAVHPVCVASVAWIAERKNTLSMIFFLLSLISFVRWRECPLAADPKPAPRKWFVLSLCAFLLALLSKGSVVALPGVLLLLAWWQGNRDNPAFKWKDLRPVVRSTLPYFALSVVFAAVTIWFQFHRTMGEQLVNHLGPMEKIVAAAWAIGFYLSKVIWPVSLSMIYPPWELDARLILVCLPACVLLLLLFVPSVRQHWRHIVLAFGYFFLLLLPILGFVDMYYFTYSRVADHWQYLAIIGPITLFTAAIRHFLRKRFPTGPIRGSAATIVIAVFGFLSLNRATTFAQPEKLWHDTLAKNPQCWAAHVHLGDLAANENNHEKALGHFHDAIRLNKTSATTHFNLANSLVALGRIDEACSAYTEALRHKPNYPEAHYNFGLALERQSKPEEALSHYRAAVKINPAHAGAHNNAGNILASRSDDAEAAHHYEQALHANPALPEARNNLANVLQRMGKVEESVAHYRKALELKPGYVDAHKNLAVALKTLGKTEEAAAHVQEAEKLMSAPR